MQTSHQDSTKGYQHMNRSTKLSKKKECKYPRQHTRYFQRCARQHPLYSQRCIVSMLKKAARWSRQEVILSPTQVVYAESSAGRASEGREEEKKGQRPAFGHTGAKDHGWRYVTCCQTSCVRPMGPRRCVHIDVLPHASDYAKRGLTAYVLSSETNNCHISNALPVRLLAAPLVSAAGALRVSTFWGDTSSSARRPSKPSAKCVCARMGLPVR